VRKPVKNVAASVRQKLANLAKESKRPFAELLQYYAMERFLYRLSLSEYKDRLVLKGALMFVAWGTPRSRATKDIDLLARTGKSVKNLAALTQDICRMEVETDFYGQITEYLALMIHVPREALEEIWNDPRLHGQVVEFVRSLLFEDHVPLSPSKDEAELMSRVGEPFDRYAMEAYACMRGNDYSDPKATAKELNYHDWEDVSRNNGLTQDLRRLLGPRLPALLAEHTEEERFASLVARRPNAKKLVAEFKKNRDRFFGKK